MIFLQPILALLAALVLAGCTENADSPPSSVSPIRYAVVQEQRLSLNSSLPGRVSALVVSEVRP